MMNARTLLVLLAATALVSLAACPPAQAPSPALLRGAPDAGASPADGGADADAATLAKAASLSPSPFPGDGDGPLPPSMYGRHRRTPRDSADRCELADSNIEAAAAEILATPTGPRVSVTPWDHRAKPAYYDRIIERFALNEREKRLLAKNGFAVLGRASMGPYARAFHEIYQSELPLYVSADAIFHAVFKSHDAIVADIERDTLVDREKHLLEALHAALPAAAKGYPPEVAGDLDLYLTVARSLLEEKNVPPVLAASTELAPILALAQKAEGMSTVMLFGRSRVVDFSELEPRGHYATYRDGALKPYFRASMWLARLEFNLVSRSSRSSAPGFVPDPRETPREAIDALALADLADRSGMLDDVRVFDETWRALAGRREDVSLHELRKLRATAGISSLRDVDAFERLKAAIGDDYVRTARIHYMPQGSVRLPAIATLLGPRIVPDAAAETELVHARVDSRFLLGAGDVAYLLGHERARSLLAAELKRFPALQAKLDDGRRLVQSSSSTDLYGRWLTAIGELARPVDAQAPSFMHSAAFADLRINSTMAAYGQLRHNHVLLVGQTYDEGGCEIPDAYLEPVPSVYEALQAFAAEGAQVASLLGHKDGKAYFERLHGRLDVLRRIALHEQSGQPLTEAMKRYLAMVVEIRPPSSDGPGSYDGWYFDLFPSIGDGLATAAFVADYYTSSNAETVVYAGATEPELGLFVVDSAGPPRVMVGPVARAFELRAPLSKRLGDSDVSAVTKGMREPWSHSYRVAAASAPPLRLTFEGGSVKVESTRHLGKIVVEMLDHHRVPVQRGSGVAGPTPAQVNLARVVADEERYGEVLRLKLGDFVYETPGYLYGGSSFALGGMKQTWEMNP